MQGLDKLSEYGDGLPAAQLSENLGRAGPCWAVLARPGLQALLVWPSCFLRPPCLTLSIYTFLLAPAAAPHQQQSSSSRHQQPSSHGAAALPPCRRGGGEGRRPERDHASLRPAQRAATAARCPVRLTTRRSLLQLLDYEEADEEAATADAAKEGAQVSLAPGDGLHCGLARQLTGARLQVLPRHSLISARGAPSRPAGEEGLCGHPQQRLQGLPAQA